MKKTLCSALLLLALAPCAFAAAPKLTDYEHHFYTPESLAYMAKLDPEGYPYYDTEKKILYVAKGISFNLGSTPSGYDIVEIGPERIKAMKKAGIDVAYLSHATNYEELSDRPGAVELAKSINNTVAKAVKKYPEYFRGTITLPVGNIEASLQEMDRCVNELGFRIWHTHSNYMGLGHLDDDKYRPLLKRAAELGIPVYVHPHVPGYDRIAEMGGAMAGAGFGYGVDVMTTVFRLIVKGVFDDIPNLRIIIGHMGEYFPYYIERIDNRFSYPTGGVSNNKHVPSYYFKNGQISFTTSGTTQLSTFKCAKESIGIDNILYGSDYPYEAPEDSVNYVKNLPLTEEERAKLYEGNGARLTGAAK